MNFLTEIIIGKSNKIYQKIIDIERMAMQIRLSNGMSFKKQLPEVVEKSFEVNGITFEQGDILVRPMYNKFNLFHLKHFGYYYGTCSEGKHYIVNKEEDGYIYVRELSEYMKEINYDEIEIIKKEPETTIEEIIERGLKIENEPYTALENNCQHFINYSVFGSYNSISADQMKEKVLDKVANFKNRRKQI